LFQTFFSFEGCAVRRLPGGRSCLGVGVGVGVGVTVAVGEAAARLSASPALLPRHQRAAITPDPNSTMIKIAAAIASRGRFEAFFTSGTFNRSNSGRFVATDGSVTCFGIRSELLVDAWT